VLYFDQVKMKNELPSRLEIVEPSRCTDIRMNSGLIRQSTVNSKEKRGNENGNE
jgi:hypothetical protein